MDKRFAILEDNVVVNLVTAENSEYLALVLPDRQTFVEETGATGPAMIGKRYSSSLNKFEQSIISTQWTWDENRFEWIAPKDYPSDGKNYYWSDSDSNWIELVFPTDGVIEVKETI